MSYGNQGGIIGGMINISVNKDKALSFMSNIEMIVEFCFVNLVTHYKEDSARFSRMYVFVLHVI